MNRPCERWHPDPRDHEASCRVCWLDLHDARYHALHRGLKVSDVPAGRVTPVPSARKHVRRCPLRGLWDWSVQDGMGRTLDSGTEKTEEAAEREAAAALGAVK